MECCGKLQRSYACGYYAKMCRVFVMKVGRGMVLILLGEDFDSAQVQSVQPRPSHVHPPQVMICQLIEHSRTDVDISGLTPGACFLLVKQPNLAADKNSQRSTTVKSTLSVLPSSLVLLARIFFPQRGFWLGLLPVCTASKVKCDTATIGESSLLSMPHAPRAGL